MIKTFFKFALFALSLFCTGLAVAKNDSLAGSVTFGTARIKEPLNDQLKASAGEKKTALGNELLQSMGTNHGGGGSGDRKYIEDISTRAFNILKQIEVFHALTMTDGTIVSANELSDALSEALATNDIILVNSSKKKNKVCPLKDSTNSCVEFLSDAENKQLSIDLGGIARHFADKQISDKSQQRLYFYQMMIHEAFRMAKKVDRNFRYSSQLAQIVDQYDNNFGRIGFFLGMPDPCWKSSALPLGCSPTRMKDQDSEAQYDRTMQLKDLIGAQFYQIENEGFTYMTFKQFGQNLYVEKISTYNGTIEIENTFNCGNSLGVDLSKKFNCNEAETTFYVTIDLNKPAGASMFMDLFFGQNVGPRGAWVKKTGF